MKKTEISTILLTLWDNIDQSKKQDLVRAAFEACPEKAMEKYIKSICDDLPAIMNEGADENALREKAAYAIGRADAGLPSGRAKKEAKADEAPSDAAPSDEAPAEPATAGSEGEPVDVGDELL